MITYPVRLLFVCLFSIQFLYTITANAQANPPELVKVIPKSANTAVLEKFGNTPVSYFTGLPNISIPLFNITSGKVNLPISLSYHAGGIKVEEVASWVGLGWGLSTGGIISRSVRGTPDESYNGYSNNPSMTVRQMIDGYNNPSLITQINYNLTQAGKGLYDTEADIYNYSIGNESGKFIYNQEDHAFYTIPKKNVKIEYDPFTASFKITLASGQVCNFKTKEYTTTQSICATGSPEGNRSVTSWSVDEIISEDKRDTVKFTYTNGSYSYNSLGSESNYSLESSSGSSDGTPPDLSRTQCQQNNIIENVRISQINFRSGSLKFNASSSTRCDLQKDQALDNMELYDLSGNLIKKWKLNYGYFGSSTDYPSNCDDYNQSISLRLQLKSIAQIDVKTNISENPYSFGYNDDFPLPSRLSYAQDYWGYYNGILANTTLIPSYSLTAPIGPIYYAGADRSVVPQYALSGTLKKVTYPSGGTTDYLFESNWISEKNLDPGFDINQEALYGDGQGIQTQYEKTFVIDYPPSEYNNKKGGAFLSFNFGEVGCDLSAGASSCAILTISGVSPGAPGATINAAVNNIYYPNGTYKLTASFNQNPARFADFYFIATWKSEKASDSTIQQRYTGGIRVKTIADYDGINHANDVIKNYEYLKEDGSGLSSGSIIGFPIPNNFLMQGFLNRYWSGTATILDRYFTKASAYSSIALVQTGGSYTSYNFVTVTQNNNGKSTFRFSQIGDVISNVPPFISISNDWLRGNLLEQTDYKSSDASFTKVKRLTNNYGGSSLDKLSHGLKIAFVQTLSGNSGSFQYLQDIERFAIPLFDEYFDTSSQLITTKTIDRQYDPSDTTQAVVKVSDFDYNSSHLMLAKERQLNSAGDSLMTAYKYPQDYVNVSGTDNTSQGISNLITNNIYQPIEITTQKKTGGVVKNISSVFNIYKPNNPVIDTIFSASGSVDLSSVSNGKVLKSSLYEGRVTYKNYDSRNNITEQLMVNGTSNCYLWSYNKTYPVAEIKNADYASVTGILGTSAIEAFSNLVAPDKATIDAFIAPLKSGLPTAQISSYSYIPLVGIKSATDVKGYTTYYEYDGLQRLKTVKDHDGNIIKSNSYHYKN